MILSSFLLFCFLGQVYITKYALYLGHSAGVFTFISFTVFILLLLLPCNVFYLNSRKELALILKNVLIAPFG